MEEQTEQNDNQSLSNELTPKEATLHKLTTDKDGNNILEEVKPNTNKKSVSVLDYIRNSKTENVKKTAFGDLHTVKLNELNEPVLRGFNKPILANIYARNENSTWSSISEWDEQRKSHEKLREWLDVSNEKEAEYKSIVVLFRSKYEKEYGFKIIPNYFIDWLDSRFSMIDFCKLKELDILFQLHEYCKSLNDKFENSKVIPYNLGYIKDDNSIFIEKTRTQFLSNEDYFNVFESNEKRLICEEVLKRLKWIDENSLSWILGEKDKRPLRVFIEYMLPLSYFKDKQSYTSLFPVLSKRYWGKASKGLNPIEDKEYLIMQINKKLQSVLDEKK